MKIWWRYLFSRLTKTFLFLLFSLFTVYVIVDLSVHGVRFFSKSSFTEVFCYYLQTFSSFLELFFMLAFLLAVMRVLSDLSAHREIVALQIAGFSKKRLLTPFFVLAGILSSLCYVNSEWIFPNAQDTAEAFKKIHKTEKRHSTAQVYSLSLEDHSVVVYQRFEKKKKELFDVFWIRTPDDIWHMKTLQIDSLSGHYVNHFTRNSKNQLEKSASFLTRNFPEIPWSHPAVLHGFVPYENRPISALFAQSWRSSAERPKISSHLLYKLTVPLIPFLILFAVAPIFISFSRYRPLLLIAAGSVFSLLSLKMILEGMLILGENQVLSPPIALLTPVGLAFLFSFSSFAKME